MKEKIKKKDKVVFISGAAGGLGSALVKIFVKNSYRVIAADVAIMDLPDPEGNGKIHYKKLDITNLKQIDALRDELALHQSGLDILINAAGIYDSFPLTEADPDVFMQMMNVNLHGAVNLVQSMLDPLIKNKGRVIVVTSESYKIQALFQPYMVSKASLEAYCRVARQELALKGVKLTVIRPGAINTPLLKWMKSPVASEKYPVYNEELKKSWEQSVKIVGRISSPETVARKIFKAATDTYPKRVYRINNSILLNLVSILPNSFFEWLMIKMFRLKNNERP